MPLMISPKATNAIMRALRDQGMTGPTLRISNTPTISPMGFPDSPLNKSRRLRRTPMDEAAIADVRNRTGSGPFLEVQYV